MYIINNNRVTLALFVCVTCFFGADSQNNLPVNVALVNPSFESQQTNKGEWLLKDDAKIVSDNEANVNTAKDGKHWLLLPSLSSAGQCLGRWENLVVGSNDRLFATFTMSSLQEASKATQSNGVIDAPLVAVKVSIWISSSSQTWEGGREVANKTISDRTNHVLGDFNSYIDGFAVLSMEQGAQEKRSYVWIVFKNEVRLSDQHSGMEHCTLLDDVAVSMSSVPQLTEDRPNLMMVLQDDLGFGDVSSFNAGSKVTTPNIDRIASQGMRFTDAHSGATICGPSRVALLTGTVPSKLGVHGNFVTPRASLGPSTISAGTATIATMCRSQVSQEFLSFHIHGCIIIS
jgi:hypothetical protein